VEWGNRIPGMPRGQLKLLGEWTYASRASVGLGFAWFDPPVRPRRQPLRPGLLELRPARQQLLYRARKHLQPGGRDARAVRCPGRAALDLARASIRITVA